jgi:hypothetical protein
MYKRFNADPRLWEEDRNRIRAAGWKFVGDPVEELR